MRLSLKSACLWLVGIAGVGMFGYSLTQQTAIQRQMNDTMGQINDSIQATGQVVQQTSIVLQPLDATTQSLGAIEVDESKASSNLASMNQHLSAIGNTERQIIGRLDNLNSVTAQVSTTLDNMQSLTVQIKSASDLSVQQASIEASNVGSLNSMTTTSIAYLHAINQRLAALRFLP